jgi:serine/threonine protein kinase/Tol biopolymer transport system component
MALSSGSQLGPYEIVAPLGAGGMGEVYQARDTRLGRDVAIKVLAGELSASAEIRARFEREARTVSSLNHPHICVLHDVGREGEVDFLVMELLKGETLAQRLERGPLPVAEAVKIGAQIADALDRAHRAGVVHRDLKPGNVMLTRMGAKLLDFGLARTAGLAGPSDSGATVAALTQSPTVAEPLTAEGTILGTFQYMAPEQLEGQEADARCDVWALGCVLYEMVTGRRAFEAKSQASLIGAIMHAEPPPLSQVSSLSPPVLDRLVTTCLAKDPDDRLQSAHDAKLQLGWLSENPTSMTSESSPAHQGGSSRPRWAALVVLAVVAMSLGALAAAWLLPRGGTAPEPRTAQRYVMASGNLESASTPVLSPDEAYVILCVRKESSTQLYRRNLSSLDLVPIAGTEEGEAPFFSPDGTWIGYCTTDGLRKVPAQGGVSQRVVAYSQPSAADWGDDGMIYFTARSGGMDGTMALARVAETGGAPEVVARLEGGDRESWLPEILPSGIVLISILGPQDSIEAVHPDGTRHTVLEGAFLGRYSPGGYLLYRDMESQAVLAAPFDPQAARITGPAVAMTEPVEANYCFDLQGDALVYVPVARHGAGREVVWLDRDGTVTPAVEPTGNWAQPRISPDGRRLLVRKIAAQCQLWMFDLVRGGVTRFTHEDDNHAPLWSPDGRSIAYDRADAADVVIVTLDGTREVTVVAKGRDRGTPRSWSGEWLAYTVIGVGTRSDVWVRPVDGSTPPTPVAATEFEERSPALSPDARWVAYTSDESGKEEVRISACPADGRTWQASIAGGQNPLWSRDGDELYFVSGADMMAVSVEANEELNLGVPRVLFSGGFTISQDGDLDVAPDGRFVAIGDTEGEFEGEHVIMLQNWSQELQRISSARN